MMSCPFAIPLYNPAPPSTPTASACSQPSGQGAPTTVTAWAAGGGAGQTFIGVFSIIQASPQSASSATSNAASSAASTTTASSASASVSSASSGQSPVSSSNTAPSSTLEQSSTATAAVSMTSYATTTGMVATPTHTSSTSTPTIAPAHGLSSGAAAGIGIGCAVAGAIIATLIVFLCLGMRKRRDSSGEKRDAVTEMSYMGGSKGVEDNSPASAASYHSRVPLLDVVGTSIPQPVEDAAIVSGFTKLSSLIKNHITSYYGKKGHVPDKQNLRVLTGVSVEEATVMEHLLRDSKTCHATLRTCISRTVFSRIASKKGTLATLLPQDIGSLVGMIAPSQDRSPAKNKAFAHWRTVTAYLTKPIYGSATWSATDTRNHDIQNLLTSLDDILEPFSASPTKDEQRRQNLEEILKRAASLAFLIFSQPSDWAIDWEARAAGGRPRGLVVTPALVQETDDGGQPLKSPRRLVEAESL